MDSFLRVVGGILGLDVDDSKAPSVASMGQNGNSRRAEKPPRCALCRQEHWTNMCTAYGTTAARLAKAKELKLCLKCLRSNHPTSECRAKGSCYKCKGSHNSAFCNQPPRNALNITHGSTARAPFNVATSASSGHLEGARVRPSANAEETNTGSSTTKPAAHCALCQQDHWTDKCTIYRTFEARVNKATQMKMCIKCFRTSHQTSECRSEGSCYYCKGPHNSAFCTETPVGVISSNGRKRAEGWTTTKPVAHCAFCQQDHWPDKCTVYRTVEARINRATQMKMCFKCFRTNHQTTGCISKGSCYYCKGPHNSAFCIKTPVRAANSDCSKGAGVARTEQMRYVNIGSNNETVPKPFDCGSVDKSIGGPAAASIDDDSAIVRALTNRIEELETDRNAKVHDLNEKIVELEGQVLCKICSQRPADTAYQCGHTICSECDKRVSRHAMEYGTALLCCFCRKRVVSRIHIYL